MTLSYLPHSDTLANHPGNLCLTYSVITSESFVTGAYSKNVPSMVAISRMVLALNKF